MVLDNFEVNKSFAKEDLKAVFYLNEHTACDTHDLIKCDCQAGKPAEPAVDECEGEELDKTKTKMKMKRRGPGRGLLRGNARRRSCKNSDGDNKADECSAILKQWEHIGDCSKINDSIIAGAGVDKVISFAFYMRSDKKIESNSIREDKGNEIIKDVKEKEEEEEEEKEEEIKDGDDEEDIYVDVNTETNTTITTDNNNNKEEENNEKMLYEGDDDIFSDINLE